MRFLKSLLLVLGLFSLSAVTHASFTPYPVGITDAGTVVLSAPSTLCPNGPLGFPTTACYFVESDFGPGPNFFSVGLPNLPFDNGSTCAGLPAGADVALSRCNGGFYIFEEIGSPNGRVFDGFGAYASTPDPRFDAASIDAVVLNRKGQFAFASGAEELDHFGSVLTPEPCTFALLGTGLLSAVGFVRRSSHRAHEHSL